MPVSDELIQRLKDLKANIESFLKLHRNPYDSTCHNELAERLERVEAMLMKLTGEQGGDNCDHDTSTDTGDTNTGGGTDTGNNSSDMGDNTGDTGGSSALDNLHQEVEQARAAAREALATVEDLKAPQISIEDTEKAKVEAYVAKAKEFLDAYAAAGDSEKAAFDQANSGYVAEIEQSYNWNANDFLPRANGATPVDSGTGGNSNDSSTGDTPVDSGNSGQSISGSVGRNGTNNEADVKVVQELLNGKGGKLTVDGKIGNKTIGSIESFQKSLGMGSPDGLIEPGKNTWKGLIGSGGSVDPNHVATGGSTGGSSFDPGEPLAAGSKPGTSNFPLREMCVSASRPDLVEEPPQSLWANMQKLMNNLEVIRSAVGGAINVNSGYRAPALNTAIGGASDSQHMRATAADIWTSKLSTGQFYDLILNLMDTGKITPGAVIYYPNDGFVHYDIRGHRTTWTNY